MEKSRLWEIYHALDPADYKQLRKWVRSPVFNQREHVVALFDYLEQVYHKGKQPNREVAFAELFPSTPFDDHKLRLSMSLLLKATEQYLIWQEVQNDKVGTQLHLARAYRRLGAERHFTKAMRKVENQQATQPWRNADYYSHQHAYYREHYEYLTEHQRAKELPLEAVQSHLDIAYLATKLRQSCLMVSHQAVFKQDYNYGMLAEALAFVEREEYLRYPAISVYYYAYLALAKPDHPEYFSTLKSELLAHRSIFPKVELRGLFLLAINYCIRQLNQGQQQYAREGLELYQEGLKAAVLQWDGLISNFAYTNIVALSVVCEEYAWAEHFVHAYRSKLDVRYQEDTFCYNLAVLEYKQGHFDEALSLLLFTQFPDTLLNISAKTITLKIYYELGEYDLLQAHLDAMRSFLQRKKMLASHKENYANLIGFVKKILDLIPGAVSKRKKLREKIENTTRLAERSWLLEQLET